MIAFIGGQRGQGWQIHTMADDGTNLRCLTNIPRGAWMTDLLWSPDGQSLAFTFKEHMMQPSYHICTIAVDSQAIRHLTDVQRYCFGLQWLSNNQIIYSERIFPPPFQPNPVVERYLCSMLPDGSQPQRLFDLNRDGDITFSLDGTRLANASPDHQLSIRHADGSSPVFVDLPGLKIRRITWSPDGQLLAFAAVAAKSRRFVYEDLYVVSVDGTDAKRIGRMLGQDFGGSFAVSPDDQEVVSFGSRSPDGDGIITITHLQTFKSRKIAVVSSDPNQQGLPGYPVWSPDGRSLYYHTFVSPYVHTYRADLTTGQAELIVGNGAALVNIQGLVMR